jgi:uncharacterized glyoxalase superfamily protein PhnB
MTTTGTLQQPRSITSEVTVSVDPKTAFAIFTDEMDLWWVRGPINFHDASRAIGMRCEPGVGGRLLELYREDASDALEVGRVTLWRPGDTLAWDSSLDDVTIEVRFEPVAEGTRVTVTATIPAGGADRGGTSWVRVVPGWFGAWCAHRDSASREPVETGRLALALYYPKPSEAARWLAAAFGFALDLEPSGDDEHSWIEFSIGNSSIMVFQRDDAPKGDSVTHVPWVYVDDLDSHLDNARDHGATIISGIKQHGYRAYQAADLEGYRWIFAQARPTM